MWWCIEDTQEDRGFFGAAHAVVDRVGQRFRAHEVVGRCVDERAVVVDFQRAAVWRGRYRGHARKNWDAIDFGQRDRIVVDVAIVGQRVASCRCIQLRDGYVVVGIWIVVDGVVAVRFDADRDGGIVGRTTWIDDRVVEAVFADESSRRCVLERAVQIDRDGSTLVGWDDDWFVCGFPSRWVDHSDHVAVRVAVVAQQVSFDHLVGERFQVVVAGDRRRVVWINSRVNDFDRQCAFDAVARFITDFDRHGIFANEVGRRRVGVRAVWVQFDRAAIFGWQC